MCDWRMMLEERLVVKEGVWREVYEKSRRKKRIGMRRWRVKEVLEGGRRDTARRHGDRLPVVDLSN